MPLILPDLKNLNIRDILLKTTNIKYNKNSSGGVGELFHTDGRTDRRTDKT